MRKKIKNQFTLIEVAVVLLVVVALAGVVVPMALGYAQRSHGATGAGNIAQLTANINRFEVENFEMPDGWDNLVEAGATTTAAFDKDAFGFLSLLDPHAAALKAAGVKKVYPIEATGGQYSTFGGTSATSVDVAKGLNVATLTGATVRGVLGLSNKATDTYVAFGIGESLTAIGKTIATAPYDFPEGAEKPENSYRRFIAVFNVSGEKAKFLGVVANDDGTITNVQDHINEYYEATE